MARLDKADLLELTVSRLTTLTHQQISSSLAKDISGYKKGFKDCARDTFHFLSRSQSIDTDSVNKLNNHIRSYYIEKSERAPSTSYPGAVIFTPTVSRHISDAAVQPTVQLTGLSDNYSCDQYYRRHYYCHRANDSVNTSLNSSCDMSLDSSSNSSPEKLVPIQQTVSGDVWRPW